MNRKPNKELSHIRSVLGGAISSCGGKSDKGLGLIWNKWDEAVGKTIADNARPAAFNGNILIVHAESSVWIQQLQFLKKELTAKINSAIGECVVKEIKFKIGPV